MNELDATIRRKVIAGGKAVGALIVLMDNGAIPLETRDLMRVIVDQWESKVPEPAHCRHREKCAGLRRCPRDPVCID